MTVYADIKAFALGARQSDDITLVVAKIEEGGYAGPGLGDLTAKAVEHRRLGP